MRFKSLVLLMLFAVQHGWCQKSSSPGWGLSEFLSRVMAGNLELMMERYELSAAEAASRAAKVYPDPVLEVITPRLNQEDFKGFPRNMAFEMEIPLELWGQRSSRLNMARAAQLEASARLEDFTRFLLAEATRIYIEGVKASMVLQRHETSLDQLEQLVRVNKSLFEAGETGAIDLVKARVEARNQEALVHESKAQVASILSEAQVLMGGIVPGFPGFEGDLAFKPVITPLDELVQHAMGNRPDIQAARHRVEEMYQATRLARAGRLPGLSLMAGYHNEGAVVQGRGVGMAYTGVVVPLKFSGLNTGAYRESQFRLEQSRVSLQREELKVEAGVRKAHEQYLHAVSKLDLFQGSILGDALMVRDAVNTSYRLGEVSLLELLDAQRVLNETTLSYYEALSGKALSLVELSLECGQWLVELK